ncbi:MAG: hypothetical protein AVDCRST_MAG64-1858, partial [uncultured Phycisphaerae bacterium]
MLTRPSHRLLNNASLAALVCAAVLASASRSAAEAAPDQKVVFNRDVRPILSDKCFACHGFDPKTRKGGVRLDTQEGATVGKDGKPGSVVPGDLAKSELWTRINSADPDELMPPADSHKKLSAAEKDIFKRWIEQGAAYQKHWSFEPIVRPAVPQPAPAAGQVRNPIDAFLVERLDREQLKPSAEADRNTLIRRVAFALNGLPPTPAEVDAFVNDPAPDAYEKMVDRYLATPRFGEEMARHWLDVARYGDTHGLHLDNERQMWAYRDYVVKSFNDNKPFDVFTVEQLAGDQLPDAGKPSPTKEQLTATGFSRCNVTTSEGGSIEAELTFRYAVDRASTAMTTWMGLTGGCAVCHDHKFDPISAKEFYSMYAFFYSNADPGFDGNALLTNPVAKLSTPESEKKLAEFDAQIAAKQVELDAKTAVVAYTDPATVTPAPAADVLETVWIEDEFPAGANVQSAGAPTQFVMAAEGGQVLSGARAIKRTEAGFGQDFYQGGAAPLDILPQGKIFAHVFLDPANLPKTIMVQFFKGDWMHRAVWGDYDAIGFGAPNTTQKVNFGPLPEAGKWVRLEIPIDKVGLVPGEPINGVAVTQYGGTVYWDKVGIARPSEPAVDPARSMLAWQKSRVGQDTPGVPPEVNQLLKDGPEKVTNPDQVKRLRDYYLQNVCADTKAQLGALPGVLAAIRQQRTEFENTIPSTFVFTDLPTPRDAFVMVRGAYDKPGEKVEPGTLAVLPPLQKANPAGRATRLDLAKWLVAPEHPMTARVAANRLWQQFFGTGLVKSSEDFGSQGEPPSHPELLDWLASEFRDTGWDQKRFVKLLVSSAAFRQNTAVSPELMSRDPENRLYARGPRFRLDAEQIRDNVLYVSGLINLEMGGKGVRTYQPPNIWEPVGFVGSNTSTYTQDTGPALYRRSLYTFLKRTAPPPFMSNFDAPNREASCSRRDRSNTPLQALQLMNDVQHVEAARAMAQRMLTEGGATPADRIAFAYRSILARQPDGFEAEVVGAQLAAHLARYQGDQEAAKKLISHGESKPKEDLPPAELAAYTLVANM